MTIEHTASRTWTINGVTEYPTQVDAAEQHRAQGVNLEADDGGLNVVVTGTKRRWRLRWESPKPDIVDRIKALARSISATDHEGTSFTAIIPIGFPRYGLTHGDAGSTAGTTYTLELELWQA